MKSLQIIFSNPRYFGPVWVFASLNILFGTWIIYIPTIKEKIGISEGELGIAIFFLALGTFSIFPFAPKLIDKIGVGKASGYAVFLLTLVIVLPFLADSLYTLAGALFTFGLVSGFLDIAMNTLVTEIEKEDKVGFMSAAHGFFSLGGVIAGLGSFLILSISNPLVHIVLVAVITLLINFVLYKSYANIKSPKVIKEQVKKKNYKPFLLLGLISFIIMGSEGAIADWSGLFLKKISLAPELLIGAGFFAFSVMMTVGRFFGDGLNTKYGSVKIVISGIALAVFGYLLVLSGYLYLTIIGFAFIGLGFSVIIPELFRIGGNIKGVDAAQGIAFIAGTGYAGFLSMPLIMGFFAEVASLKLSFIVLLILSAISLMISFLVKK